MITIQPTTPRASREYSGSILPEKLAIYPEINALIEQEKKVPIEITKDLSLRAKIIDACGLTCTFCHNEGTPVAIDNPEGTIAVRGIAGKSGRISVFSGMNGVDFLPGRMDPQDPAFSDALTSLRDGLGLNELHLTGGEPTLHPYLPELIKTARDAGYSVGMTSNGEKGGQKMYECAKQGLEKVNFSIFGTTPSELAEVQSERFRDTALAARKLAALHSSIIAAADAGIKVSANMVISTSKDEERARRVIDDFDPRLDLRLLPDLANTSESTLAIYSLLNVLSAKPLVTQVEAGSSNARVRYALPCGRTLAFKQIRQARLEVCQDCPLNNPQDCMEGFYGTRLYIDKDRTYRVGVCLLRMDLVSPLDSFFDTDLPAQVLALREREYQDMQNFYDMGDK